MAHPTSERAGGRSRHTPSATAHALFEAVLGVLVRLLPSVALPPAPVRAVFPGTAKPGRLARAFVERLAASLPPTLRPPR